MWRWVPLVENLPDTGLKGQFRFLKSSAPWLILGATLLGNGGTFAWYSYVTPLLTNVAGFPAHTITFLMILAGFGMVVGNLTGGRLSDRYSPGRVAAFAPGDDLCRFAFYFLFCSYILVGGRTDVFVYGWVICSFESSTGIVDPLFKRWGNVGGCQCASRF